jgi:hypothetical protein
MCIKKMQSQIVWITLVSVVITIITLATSSHVYAQKSPPLTENGTCASCHEDLYFLHDTGKWFCIREAPMRCIDCHGGNPNAITQAEAHADRKVHPILNENISKCQECHPEECMERVARFDQIAGISDVLVVAPYQPKLSLPIEEIQATSVTEPVAHPTWVSFIEFIALVLITGLALAIYFVHKAQHTQK